MCTTWPPASSPCTWGSSAEGGRRRAPLPPGPLGRRRPAAAVRQLARGRCRRRRAGRERPHHRARPHDRALGGDRCAPRPGRGGRHGGAGGCRRARLQRVLDLAAAAGPGAVRGPSSRTGSDRASLRRLRDSRRPRQPAGAGRCARPSCACRRPGMRPTSRHCKPSHAEMPRAPHVLTARSRAPATPTDLAHAELLGLEGRCAYSPHRVLGLIRDRQTGRGVPAVDRCRRKDDGTPSWRLARQQALF